MVRRNSIPGGRNCMNKDPATSLSFIWKLIFYMNILKGPMSTLFTFPVTFFPVSSFPVTPPCCYIFLPSPLLLLSLPSLAVVSHLAAIQYEHKERISEERRENGRGRLQIWHAPTDAACCRILGLTLWSWDSSGALSPPLLPNSELHCVFSCSSFHEPRCSGIHSPLNPNTAFLESYIGSVLLHATIP